MHEEDTHSFVVKVWLEETPPEARCSTWRGHITHVTTRRRRYVQTLADIADFIAGYLERSGIRLPIWMRLKRWLRRRRP